MFCPQCGSTQPVELKFCKSCGVNLETVRHAAAIGNPHEKIERGITPELKRNTEIKAGVIASSAGIGVMIFLYFLMQGIILSGQNPPSDDAILSRIWLAGIIPFFVGLALIINGVFAGKRQIEIARQRTLIEQNVLPNTGENPALRPANYVEFPAPSFGVTEGTTKHLSTPNPRS